MSTNGSKNTNGGLKRAIEGVLIAVVIYAGGLITRGGFDFSDQWDDLLGSILLIAGLAWLWKRG